MKALGWGLVLGAASLAGAGQVAGREPGARATGKTVAGSQAVTAEDAAALSRALAAYDNGQGAAARAELERLAMRYPVNFAANEAAGLLAMEGGDYGRALPYLEHAAAADRRSAAGQANLGAAYLAAGRPSEAVRALQRAALLDARNAQTLSSLGHALFADHQLEEAAEVFARAVALGSTDVDDAYNEAVALYGVRKDGQAVAVLERIPAAQRGEPVESLWGDAEERQGHYKEALEHLQAAARLNATEATTYALAAELLRHWSWAPAAEITGFGVRQFPESRRMRLADGVAAYGAGKYPQAAAIFGALLALDPTNESYGSLLGRSCAAAGGSEAAECLALVAFAERQPGNAPIDVSAAVSLLHQPATDEVGGQNERIERALRLLRKAIQRDPRLPEAWYQLGVLQQQRSEWKESAASLERAIELRPTFAEAHYRLSRAYSHSGEAERARAEIALQQRYAQEEKDESAAKLKEVTIFLVASH